MEEFTKIQSLKEGASVAIVDISKREIRMKFKQSAFVGIGTGGIFYCNAEQVLDTQVGKPMTQ